MRYLRKTCPLIVVTLVSVLFLTGVAVSNEEESNNNVAPKIISVFEDHQNLLQVSATYAVSWHLLVAALEQEGVSFDVIPSNWNSSINRLKNGKKDLVFGAFKTPERERWAIFSLPLMPEYNALYALNSHPVVSLSEITDFSNYAVAVIEQSSQLGLAKELGFDNIYAAAERGKLCTLLFSKRVDFIITQGSYPFTCDQPGEVKRYPPLKTQYYRVMGMDKEATRDLMNSINTGLQKVVQSGQLEELLQQFPDASVLDKWKSQFLKEANTTPDPDTNN